MRINIKNIGKIKEADVNLNGITLIAGKNDTGKSTVGKVLFSIFNGLHDIKKKMNDEKKEAIERIIEGLLYDTGYMEKEKELSEISNKRDMITKEILNIDIEIDKNNIDKYIKEILENSNIKLKL
jgi:ABC transporter, ATP-binding protein